MAGKKVALDKSASSYYFFLTALENESSLTEDDIKDSMKGVKLKV